MIEKVDDICQQSLFGFCIALPLHSCKYLLLFCSRNNARKCRSSVKGAGFTPKENAIFFNDFRKIVIHIFLISFPIYSQKVLELQFPLKLKPWKSISKTRISQSYVDLSGTQFFFIVFIRFTKFVRNQITEKWVSN